jgi:hypothetical protein
MVSTINPVGSLYLIELQEPFESLALQFVPNEIGFNYQGNFQAVLPTGRNTPIFHYTGGKDDLSLNLVFYAEEEHEIKKKIDWLRSLRYADGYNNPARRVLLQFGNLFGNEEKWVVNSVAGKFLDFMQVNNYAPKRAEVSLSLSLSTDYNFTYKDLR